MDCNFFSSRTFVDSKAVENILSPFDHQFFSNNLPNDNQMVITNIIEYVISRINVGIGLICKEQDKEELSRSSGIWSKDPQLHS